MWEDPPLSVAPPAGINPDKKGKGGKKLASILPTRPASAKSFAERRTSIPSLPLWTKDQSPHPIPPHPPGLSKVIGLECDSYCGAVPPAEVHSLEAKYLQWSLLSGVRCPLSLF